MSGKSYVTILPSLVAIGIVLDQVTLATRTHKVSHYPAKFGSHKQCSSEDIMVLVCHIIQQDQVTKGSSMGGPECPLNKKKPLWLGAD